VANPLDPFSIEELRAELILRSSMAPRFIKVASRNRARDLRPGLGGINSAEIVAELRAKQKAVYGEDDRIEIDAIAKEGVRKIADSVAAIFRAKDVIDNGDGTVSLPETTLASEYAAAGTPLCKSEPFQRQPSGAVCTAFLVGKDVMATAGHCLDESNMKARRLVFGYRMRPDGTAVTTVQASDVYQATEILGRKEEDAGADWAVVRLDREVTGRTPLTVRQSGKVDDGQSLFVMGHPIGLPLKYAGSAAVRRNKPADFFIANLDTFGGNSGSPVFNATTLAVEGILVRGEQDFVPKGECLVSLVCPVQGCSGEECTRITLISALLEHH